MGSGDRLLMGIIISVTVLLVAITIAASRNDSEKFQLERLRIERECPTDETSAP